jgi:predicted metal-binding protein
MYSLAHVHPKKTSYLFCEIKCYCSKEALLEKIEIIYIVESEGQVSGFLMLTSSFFIDSFIFITVD